MITRCLRIAVLVACIGLVLPTACRSGTGTSTRPALVTEPTPAQQQRMETAHTAREAGDYWEALVIFREILAENPTVVPAFLGIGDVYMDQEQYGKAEPAYRRAARLDAQSFDAQCCHGMALEMLGRVAEALEAFKRALAIDPNSATASLHLTTAYLKLNDARSALAHARVAVLLDKSSGPARVNLGSVYEKMGRNKLAIEQYLAASELMEPNANLLLNLITVLAREKRYQEAVNTAEYLVKLEPSANAFERLGWAYFRTGKYDDSIEAYRAAVGIDPDHWPSWNGVGTNALNAWLLSKGENKAAIKEARRAFRRSVQLNRNQVRVITLMSNYGL